MRRRRDGRGRWTGILLEAGMVIFAVLVALAVDEWQNDRERAEQVLRARAAIETEIRANQDELLRSLPTVEDAEGSLAEMVTKMEAGETLDSWEFQAYIADFSDAAWVTARATGIMAYMDYGWVLSTARVYESQALATSVQNGLIATLGAAIVRPPDVERVTDLRGQLVMVLQMYYGLRNRYEQILSPASDADAPSHP